MKYFTLIPALALGWGLGSLRQTTDEAPAHLEQTIASPKHRHSGLRNIPTPDAPTSAGQCRQDLEHLLSQDDLHPMIRRALQDRVLRAWLEIAPASALAFVETQVAIAYKSSLGQDLFRVWVDLDPEGAEQAFSVASPALKTSCIHSFCTTLGRKDPERALDFLARQKGMQEGDSNTQIAISKIYQNWAKKDPLAAIARANLDGVPSHFPLRGWAKADPLAAWEFTSKLEDRARLLPGLARFVLPTNPDLLEKYPDVKLGPSLVESWIHFDLEGAQEFALSLPEDSALRALFDRPIAHSLTSSDPERALALFQKSGNSKNQNDSRSGLYREAFISLNSSDPERARTLLGEIPEQHRTKALSGILTHEYAADPAGAILRTREFLDDPATREQVIPALETALSWGHGSGNHDLTQIVEAIPELRPKITSYLLEGWTRTAPEAAATFLAEEAHRHAELGTSFYSNNDTNDSGTSSSQTEMGRGLAELSFSRPEFTSDWVNTLPPGDFQNHAAQSLSTNWARFDQEAAEAWVQSLPEGAMRTQAEQALAKPVDILTYEEKLALRKANSKK